MRKSYTDDDIIQAVESSTSLASVIRKLGLVPAGGNYATVKQAIRRLQLDTRHFKGQAHLRGKKLGPRRPLTALLARGSRVQSYKLKRRLLSEGVFDSVCMQCGRTTWLDRPIPLELHHRDGNALNNTLSNLALLCPNCHAFTETYRGKNKKS